MPVNNTLLTNFINRFWFAQVDANKFQYPDIYVLKTSTEYLNEIVEIEAK